MANGMNWKPNEGKRAEPEDDESDEVVDRGAESDGVVEGRTMVEAGPDGCNHEVHTLSTDPGLNTIPDASKDR